MNTKNKAKLKIRVDPETGIQHWTYEPASGQVGGIYRGKTIPGQSTAANDIEKLLDEVQQKILQPNNEPDLCMSQCLNCRQAVVSAYLPVFTCPMCDPDAYKDKNNE